MDIVRELADRAISGQIGVHNALLRFSEIKEKIRMDEIIYFVLTLTVCSLFRWGQFKDAEALADVLSDRVFRLNLQSNAIPALSHAVKAYRIRFKEYRAALPDLTVDELGFGLLLSRNITGQENAVVGICLCGYAASILADLKQLIEDARGTDTLATWKRCLAEIRALPDDYPAKAYMIGKAERVIADKKACRL